MCDQVRYTLSTKLNSADFCKLVTSLIWSDPVDSKATFSVVDESKVLSCLFNGNDIHETSRICRVRADLTIHLDKPLHNDGPGLASIQGILQPIRVRRISGSSPASASSILQQKRFPSLHRSKAYLFRINTMRGIHSLCLWGPGEGFGAYFPETITQTH